MLGQTLVQDTLDLWGWKILMRLHSAHGGSIISNTVRFPLFIRRNKTYGSKDNCNVPANWTDSGVRLLSV